MKLNLILSFLSLALFCQLASADEQRPAADDIFDVDKMLEEWREAQPERDLYIKQHAEENGFCVKYDDDGYLVWYQTSGNFVYDALSHEYSLAVSAWISSVPSQIFDIYVEYLLRSGWKDPLKLLAEPLKSEKFVLVLPGHLTFMPNKLERLHIGYGVIDDEGIRVWQKADYIVKRLLPRDAVQRMLVDGRVDPEKYAAWIEENYDLLEWDCESETFFLRKRPIVSTKSLPPLEPIDLPSIIERHKIGKGTQFQTLARVNDSEVRLEILCGSTEWTVKRDEDQFFYVLNGELAIDWRPKFNETVELSPHQSFAVPKGLWHRTRAGDAGAVVLMVGAADLSAEQAEPLAGEETSEAPETSEETVPAR